MCLKLTKDSARLKKNLRRGRKPIVCYKVLREDMEGPYKHFQWKIGLNVSDRTDIELTKQEIEDRKVNKGFHLHLDNPQIKSPYWCLYPCLYPCLSRCRCQYPCPMKIYKCEVQPEDIAAVGEWEKKTCLVATKVTMVEEVGRYWGPGE